MDSDELKSKLTQLLALKSETEIVEFKEANNNFDFAKLGKYFSALSNEANLMGKDCAWLVFGVEDKSHKIVGTKYREKRTDLDKLKREIADRTSNRITFQEIYELKMPEGRVVLFQIPPAPKGLPISFDGHFYGRDGESLVPLNLEEIERIRNQNNPDDWSAVILPEATIYDLDRKAIAYAKDRFLVKFPEFKEDIAEWDEITFLNKAKITIKGKITRATIILLGRSESELLLAPNIAKIRWVLKTVQNEEKDYDIFPPPFLLAIDKVYEKIRNLKYRYLPKGTLFPNEVLRYEPFNIREAINNCVAHNDYSKAGYINVIEFEDDRLVFSNNGTFIPGSVEKVIMQDAPEEFYRNRFLANAMFQLGLVDTRGGGIKKMFSNQIKRFFPLPDYDFEGIKTRMTLTGKILDQEFVDILSNHPDLKIRDIILLDQVQKKKDINEEELKHLKRLGFVEGRKPNFFLSHSLITPINDEILKVEYIRNKGFDDEYYKNMILEYLKKWNNASRKQIDNLLWEKLPDILDKKSKFNKITNLLQGLKKSGKIVLGNSKKWNINL
ncbi:MAG: putative DNA binding domain-containing protein [Bacteroidota bacterium]|nr:transcriptional regulator [Odoribacter sp.]MDP3645440.1 putative DNA binding domain-containing protein [Bacteroidota bacterium]